MILNQFYLKCLAHASYIVGDPGSQTAAVIDPQRDIDQYLTFAAERDLRIAHVFLTHLHADFVAGHIELRNRTGAAIYLGAKASAEYAFTPLRDGDAIEFGDVRLTAIETPGHTPESISILVYDLKEDATRPAAVFTGDTLFVGDVGRPDLRVALGWSASDLGGMLYDSLRGKLMPLPDATLVYPAHGAGSLCGRSLSRETFSTMGEQRRANYALQPMSKSAFVDLVTADQAEAPAYFTYDAVLNSQERPSLDETLADRVQPIGLEQVLALQLIGAQVLDVRDPAEFAATHLAGSINIGLHGQYATWAGTLLRRDKPIVIVAEPGRETEATLRLGRIGFDQVVGYLQDGLHSLGARPDLNASTERVSAELAARRLTGEPADRAPVTVDVRQPREREQKRIPGSVGLPLNHLAERASELPANRPLLIYCAGGYRSSIAASLLQRDGFSEVSEIAGGLAAWEAAKLPIETG